MLSTFVDWAGNPLVNIGSVSQNIRYLAGIYAFEVAIKDKIEQRLHAGYLSRLVPN